MLPTAKRMVKSVINGFGYRLDPLVLDMAEFDPGRCFISTGEVDGVTYRWLVENPEDVIQSHHASGGLYEIEELRMLRSKVGKLRTFVDIGANVGNHAIFVALDLKADHVIAFEPARKQHDILAVNIALNDLRRRFSVHKCALGSRKATSWIAKPWEHNLGAARLNEDRCGEYVRVERADDLLQGQEVSCIKIDVEGHEMKVLEGLQRTIAASRPFIYVEVDDENLSAFEEFARAKRYCKAYELKRNASSTNILLEPA